MVGWLRSYRSTPSCDGAPLDDRPGGMTRVRGHRSRLCLFFFFSRRNPSVAIAIEADFSTPTGAFTTRGSMA